MISVENLRKNYGAVEALSGISLNVAKGEIIGLLGPNGAGKTTTMKILTGYLQPTEGTAKVDGVDVVDDPIAVQSMIGYLPENAPIYEDMTVQEYLVLTAELRDIPHSDRMSRIADAVRATGLEAQLTRPIGDLSKGFRQRVGIAQAIMHRPKVLILDEPTNGLDPTQIIGVRNLIKRLAQTTTVVVSTHILHEVEAVCDRAVIIINGAIRADAKLSELTSGSGAYISVDGLEEDVVQTLGGLQGIDTVKRVGTDGSYHQYRVSGPTGADLCPGIFDAVKSQDWRLKELRPETRTLESVFRELAEKEGIQS